MTVLDLHYHEGIVKNGLSRAKLVMKDVFEHLKIIKDNELYKDKHPRWSTYLDREFGKGFSFKTFERMNVYNSLLEGVMEDYSPPTTGQANALSTNPDKAKRQWQAIANDVAKEGGSVEELTNLDVMDKMKLDRIANPDRIAHPAPPPNINSLFLAATNSAITLIERLVEIERLKNEGLIAGGFEMNRLAEKLNKINHLIKLLNNGE